MILTTGMGHLCRKLLMLGILVACFVAFNSNYMQNAEAFSACCEDCEPQWMLCRMNCYETLGASSPQLSSCVTTCSQRRNNCNSHCNFCESGGSGTFIDESAGEGGYTICFETYGCTVNQQTGICEGRVFMYRTCY